MEESRGPELYDSSIVPAGDLPTVSYDELTYKAKCAAGSSVAGGMKGASGLYGSCLQLLLVGLSAFCFVFYCIQRFAEVWRPYFFTSSRNTRPHDSAALNCPSEIVGGRTAGKTSVDRGRKNQVLQAL
ncbi:hypothetical protein AOLI_G00161200 [Acnodon oligacanthus]